MWIAPDSESEKGAKAMNLKDEIIAGESYSLEGPCGQAPAEEEIMGHK